ncbi:MAG: 4Fe-4S cluster-binding domain-containing protein [bacterium]|nr:4Fe-4S cluster-binding domain-containing protein [bacterium]
MALRLSAYTLCVNEHPDPNTVLLYSTLTKAVAVLQSSLFRDIKTGSIQETDMPTCLELAGEGLLVDGDVEEHSAFKLWLNQTRFGFSTIETVPVVTTDCNMRCAYCFGTDFSPSFMDRETCDHYITELARTIEVHGTRRLSIDYFGGEPLRNLDAIDWLARGARGLEQRFGLELRQRLTTNGYLLDAEVASHLASVGSPAYR